MREYAIHGTRNPDTGAVVYGLHVQKKYDNWHPVYASQTYDRDGIIDCLDFMQAFVKDAKSVMVGGYIYSNTPEGIAQLKADLPTT